MYSYSFRSQLVANLFDWGSFFLLMYLIGQSIPIIVQQSSFVQSVVGVFALQFIAYWYYSFLFHFLEPEEAKLKKRPVLSKVAPNVMMNHGVTFGLLYAIWKYVPESWAMNLNTGVDEWYVVFVKFWGCVFVQESMMYYLHRAAHHKSIYKHIHKQHHIYQYPAGFTALYCNPIEQILINLLPLVCGPIFTGMQIDHTYYYILWCLRWTVYEHSECEHCPWLSNLTHDKHHEFFTYNYSTLGLFDNLHDTIWTPEKTNPKLKTSKKIS